MRNKLMILWMLATLVLSAAVIAQSQFKSNFEDDEFDKIIDRFIKEDQPKINLSDILAEPSSYKNAYVLFDCRFHKPDDVFNTVYAPFEPADYINFAVWDLDVKIWRDEVANDYPFFYAKKKLPEGPEMQKTIMALNKYEHLSVLAKITAVFDNRPYFEIVALKRVCPKATVTEKALLFMRMAEDETEKKNHLEAAKLYMRAFEAGLTPDLEGLCLRRAGELHYMLKNYERSLELLRMAQARTPDDPGLKDVMDVVSHIVHTENVGEVPVDEAETSARAENAELKSKVQSLEAQNMRLKEEIHTLSEDRVKILREKGDQDEKIGQLEQRLEEQQKLIENLEKKIKEMENGGNK